MTPDVALAECGTHAVFAAEVGKYSESETVLAEPLLGRLEPGMVLLADRGFFSYALFSRAIATGADLLWRVRTDRGGPTPVHLEDLPDRSWLAHLQQTHSAAARAPEPMLVRVVDYTIDEGRDNPATYRLFTTLTDPEKYAITRAGNERCRCSVRPTPAITSSTNPAGTPASAPPPTPGRTSAAQSPASSTQHEA